MKFFFSLSLLLSSIFVFSQTCQISGFVRDGSSGDLLPNAHMTIEPGGSLVLANSYGYFSFGAKAGTVTFKVSFAGYDPLIKTVKLASDTTITCLMTSDNRLGEVSVVGRSFSSDVVKEEIGAIRLTGRELEKIPTLLGEKDIVKALQMMPGIKMGKEGTSGLYIRGGTPGQNLMLLDGVPVYNVNHLFGFFSVFTPEAVKSADVYKGAFPAKYGGRISSVIDMRMREGNLYQTKADLTIGTLSSKVVFEAPVVKGKSSVLVAARLCNSELFLNPFRKSQSYNSGKTRESTAYSFYDFNIKFFYDLRQAGKLYWSAYLGSDRLKTQTVTNKMTTDLSGQVDGELEESSTSYQWGNQTSSLRWNKNIGKKLFLNTTFLYSKYRYTQNLREHLTKIDIKRDTIYKDLNYDQLSQVVDWGCYADLDYFISTYNHLVFGVQYTDHTFTPNDKLVGISESTGYEFEQDKTYSAAGSEFNAYIEDQIVVFERWKSVLGLRYAFFQMGDQRYRSIQPRFRSSYDFGRWSVKMSGGYMVQPVHSLVSNINNRNAIIWVPSEDSIKPSTSLQFDLGAAWQLSPSYSLTAEAYWRNMNHILIYGNRESFFGLYEKWYDRVLSGRGQSYGIEVLANKTMGRTTGWVGYTWSVSTQQFDGLNQGKPFPAAFDRRHYITVMMNHQLSDRIELSGNWVFGTGEPISLSTTSYQGISDFGMRPEAISMGSLFDEEILAPNQLIWYPSVNNWRLPVYHRLDLSVGFKKEKKHGRRTWAFSLYNAYGRNNPYMVNFETDDQGQLLLKNTTFFKFLPSISYRYEFR